MKIFPLLLLLLPTPLFAAIHAIVPSSLCPNNGNGTSWSCAASSGAAGAFNAIPATLTRGDVYYLADGNYTSYHFTTAASGTTTSELRKAQSYDFGGLTGWNTATMGSSQAVFQKSSPPIFEVSASYFILNGNGQQTSSGCGVSVGASPTSEPTSPKDCGIRIDNTLCVSTSADACDNPYHIDNGVIHNLTEYVEVVGNGINNSERGLIGLYSGGGTGNDFFTVTHMFARNAGCVFFVWTNNDWSVTNSYFWHTNTDMANDCHPQYSLSEMSTSNGVEANNVYRDINGSAVFSFVSPIGTNTGWKYYNNVFFETSGHPFTTTGLDDGIVGNLNGGTNTGMLFAQNTAINLSGNATGFYPGSYTGATVQNNIWYQGTPPVFPGSLTGTLTNNSFLALGSTCPSGTANVCNNASPNPFVDWPNGNFNLATESSNWNNRATLTTPTTDINGNTFTTDRGAAQFITSGPHTYYVATTGNDSNPGTQASPWLTPAHASSIAIASDTVIFLDGTYTIAAGSTNGDWFINSAGTPGNPITYKSLNRWGAKLVGQGTGDGSTVIGVGGPYNIIQGFDVTGSDANGVILASTGATAAHNQALSNYVHDMVTPCDSNSGTAMETGAGSAYTGISNNDMIGNFVINITPAGGSGCTIHPASGIYALVPNSIIANNIVINAGTNIQSWHAATGITMFGNTSIGGTVGITIGAGDSPGGVTNDNSIVQNNIVLNASVAAIVENGSTGTHNKYIDNNVFGTSTAINLQNGNVATGTVVANPLFVNNTGTVAGNYRIQAASPAKGTGLFLVGILTDYAGNPRPQSGTSDIGAFGSGQNWFIRTDGGTRFSSNVPSGQCDGLHDAAYPGSGVNQACAYKDFRYIWDDDSGVVGLGTWQPIGGDIVAVRGCTANANQVYPSNPNCRIGWDAGVGTAGVNDWCRGVGNNICTNPTITAGSSAAHTKIMSGWAYDHPGQPVADANKIQMFGGYGLQLGTFNLAGTQWLDLVGIELTTHNQVSSGNPGFPGNCTKGGSPAFPVDCNGGTQPYDDYAQNGFVTSNTSANISFTDVKVHGFNASGFWGPIGGPITMTRVSSSNNGFAGWNFADQSDTPNAAGSSITASFVTMNSNGCYEQYPIVSALPLRACYDSNSGGFGDAWSGQDTLMDTFICDHCTMNYNTKDAFIGPHAQVKNLTVTNSVAIGNMGAQMKYGTQQFATTLFQNDLFVMNCWRQTEKLPGAPQNFSQSTGLGGSYLTNFCRAGGDGWAFLTRANSTAHFYGNTIVGANSTMMDINCGFVDTGGVHEETNCGTSPLLWTDNNMIGYTDPLVGQQPGLWFFDPGAGGSLVLTADHNNYFGVRNTSPDVCGVNNITCNNPLLSAQPAQPWPGTEAALDVYNAAPGSSFTPTVSSPLNNAGRQLTGLNTDFYGTTRTIPPIIGAVNSGGSGPVLTSITVTPNPGSVLVGSTLPMGCTSTFSDSSTAPCTSPVWTTTGAHTSINVTSGVVTGNTAGSDTITAAIGAISGTATVNVTAVIVPPKGTVSGHFTITGSCSGVCP